MASADSGSVEERIAITNVYCHFVNYLYLNLTHF